MTALSNAEQLLALARAYSEATGLTLGTVGKRACGGNHHFFERLAKGHDTSTSNSARAMEWFTANWPSNAQWPNEITKKKSIRSRHTGKNIHPIKIYRLKHGLSLLGLARRAQTTQATLSRIEAGLIKPSFDLLARLTNAMEGEVSADAIIGGHETYQEKRMSKLLPVEESNILELSQVDDQPGKLRLRLRIDRIIGWQLAIRIVQMIGDAESEAVNASATNLANDLANDGKQGPE